MKILKIQPTEENPVVVDNYPYGFKRTKIRYWVESVKKKGDRFVSQTLNPKTNKWNNPKKSTYYAVCVVYLNEKEHITYYGYYRSTSPEDYDKFINFIGDLDLNELQKEELKIIRAYIKAYEHVSYSINDKQMDEKELKEYKTEQKTIQRIINKNVAKNYLQDNK